MQLWCWYWHRKCVCSLNECRLLSAAAKITRAHYGSTCDERGSGFRVVWCVCVCVCFTTNAFPVRGDVLCGRTQVPRSSRKHLNWNTRKHSGLLGGILSAQAVTHDVCLTITAMTVTSPLSCLLAQFPGAAWGTFDAYLIIWKKKTKTKTTLKNLSHYYACV